MLQQLPSVLQLLHKGLKGHVTGLYLGIIKIKMQIFQWKERDRENSYEDSLHIIFLGIIREINIFSVVLSEDKTTKYLTLTEILLYIIYIYLYYWAQQSM